MTFDNTPASNKNTYTPTPSTDPELDQWLDSAIASKTRLMQFNPNAEEDNFSINLGKFGFKNPNDLKNFLLTPAGDTIKGEIATEIGNKEAEEEQRIFELREEEKRKHNLKAHLMLFLIEKKGHATSQLRELIEEQNQHAIHHSKQATNPAPKQSTEPNVNKELQDAIRSYDNAIKDYQEQHKELSATEQELSEQIETLEKQQTALEDKHAIYQQSLTEFETASEQYEQMSPEERDMLITAMETDIEAQTEGITKLLDSGSPGSEEKARELLNEQNALNLQLAGLYDLRSQQLEEKVFYNANGQIAPSQNDAMFTVPKDKKIVKQGNQYYLLNSNENLNDLSKEDQAQASARFENTKHELMSVKKSVENTLSLEKEFHNFDERIDKTSQQHSETHAEKMQLENQIKLLQSVRATLAQPGVDSEQDSPKPTPTLSGKARSASMPQTAPASVMGFARSFLLDFLPNKDKTISTKQLDERIDKKAANPKDAKEIRDFFKKALASLHLGQIPPLAPLPQTTMNSLLQHMARFGANPYKDGLTPLQSPMDSKGLAPQIPSPQKLAYDSVEIPQLKKPEKKVESAAPKPFNPTPFNTNPYGS